MPDCIRKIEGYYTNENNVSSQILTDDIEINILYTKCNSSEQVIIRIATAITSLGINFTIVIEIIRRKRFFIK